MDAEGARHLDFRIAQQRQWRGAAAVRRGWQAAIDPDMDRLERMGDGVREYRATPPLDVLRKELLDGWWQIRTEPLDREPDSFG
jgi:hypothetical protein